MEQIKRQIREEISVDNINILYYDLKQAQIISNTSNQTLYTYAADTTNNITMVKFKGKNYLHIDDIEYIKKEVETSKSARNSALITINEKEENDDIIKLKDNIIANLNNDLIKHENTIKELQEELRKERNDRLNFMSEMLELKRELGELREFKNNTNNLNELIETLSREKDILYKNQINNLVEANNDIMNKFDKLIDTQNAFQIMLAQKEQTSQKLIENKDRSFLDKLFKRK